LCVTETAREQQGGVVLDDEPERDLLRRVLAEDEGKPDAQQPDGGRHQRDLGASRIVATAAATPERRTTESASPRSPLPELLAQFPPSVAVVVD
jgi:hypothetical protein